MATSSTTSTTVGDGSNITQNTLIADVGDEADGWIASSTPRIVFLSVFIVFGFFGNLLLVITVCHSKRYRSITFFIFIINLAVINLCESVFNMTVLLASSAMNEWTFGQLPCRLSSFCLNLVSIVTILGLTIITADRLVAMRYKEKYEHVVSRPRIAILITFTWVHAFSFSIPIAIGCVPTSVNTYIIYCAISTGSSIVYNIANVLLCFILPLVLMVVLFIKIIRTGYKERFTIRNIISQHNYNEETSQEPRIKREIRNTNITGTLCVAWLFLEGPHVVTSYLNQFKNSIELDKAADEDLEYVWYVDLVLLWLRFSYTLALPITCFTWTKDLWKCFKDMILCRKNNSVIDESFKKGDSDSLRLERKIREEKLKEKESLASLKEQRVFQVPVLFATAQGVHIQTFENDDDSNDEDGDEDGEESLKTPKNGVLRGKTCDVVGSRDNFHFEDDTSDYDSGNEQDPFSVSHPISVRQIKEPLSERKRSLSEPKVSSDTVQQLNKNEKISNCTVGSTSEGDSGLDLSTSVLTKSNNSGNVFHVPSDKFSLHNTSDKLQTELMGTGVICLPRQTSIRQVECSNEYTELSKSSDTKHIEEHSTTVNMENEIDSNTVGVNNSQQPECPFEVGTRDSPMPKRKKKKRKDRNFDTQSITSTTSGAGIPPRPPPRLAPINALRSLGGSFCNMRSESGTSSQCSFIESNTDGGRNSALSNDMNAEVIKSACESLKNEEVLKDNTASTINRNVYKNYNAFQNTEDESVLNKFGYSHINETKREIKSVPEEAVQASTDNSETDLHKCDNETLTTDYTDNSKENVTRGKEVGFTSNDQSGIINTNARRKRREKSQTTRDILVNNSLLNDNKGYQRLMPETP